MSPLKMTEAQREQQLVEFSRLIRLALEVVDTPAENDKRRFFAIDLFRKYEALVSAGFDANQALFLVKDAK